MSFVFSSGNAKETHIMVDRVSESREGLQAINTFDKLHLCWRWIFLTVFAGSNEARYLFTNTPILAPCSISVKGLFLATKLVQQL